jgi:hypothetical protein
MDTQWQEEDPVAQLIEAVNRSEPLQYRPGVAVLKVVGAACVTLFILACLHLHH